MTPPPSGRMGAMPFKVLLYRLLDFQISEADIRMQASTLMHEA